MKTVIFLWDTADDLYNDAVTMNGLLNGESVIWKIWYNGDGRSQPANAAEDDRFFILQKGTDIVASGTVRAINFKRGNAKLSSCGMIYFELLPDMVGQPVLAGEQLNQILGGAKLSLNRSELTLDKKEICFQLEELWLKAIIENNTCKDSIPEDFWKPDHLNSVTAEALRQSILANSPVCPCCGSLLYKDDALFFRPSLIKSDCTKIAAYYDLKAQYAVLCKDCASIEKNLQ